MMKNYTLSLLIISCLIALGCSSATPETKTGSNKISAANLANQPDQTSISSANGSGTPMVGDSVPVAEDQPGIPANTAKLNTNRKLVETPGTVNEPQRMPAGENSEISTTMDKQGNFVETRLFKAHPQIDKVERTWLDPTKTFLKITLKNGKVIPVSGAKIDNFATLSASTFLELAGLKAPATPAPGTGAK